MPLSSPCELGSTENGKKRNDVSSPFIGVRSALLLRRAEEFVENTVLQSPAPVLSTVAERATSISKPRIMTAAANSFH